MRVVGCKLAEFPPIQHCGREGPGTPLDALRVSLELAYCDLGRWMSGWGWWPGRALHSTNRHTLSLFPIYFHGGRCWGLLCARIAQSKGTRCGAPPPQHRAPALQSQASKRLKTLPLAGGTPRDVGARPGPGGWTSRPASPGCSTGWMGAAPSPPRPPTEVPSPARLGAHMEGPGSPE